MHTNNIKMNIKIYIFVLSLFFYFSCKKEDISPTIINIYQDTTVIHIKDTIYVKDTTVTHIKDTIYVKDTINKNNLSPVFYDKSINKLWGHRVNITKEITPTLDKFRGIELDIIFDNTENKFYVKRSEAEPNLLSLENYFSSIINPEYYYYWLDFKNLGNDNAIISYKEMLKLVTKFNIHDKTIIESPNIEPLGYYAENNLYTSLWIPMKENITNTWIAELDFFIQKYNFTVLSCNHNVFSFIQEFFPNKNIHLWVTGISDPIEQEKKAREFAQYPQVKVILVNKTSSNFLIKL